MGTYVIAACLLYTSRYDFENWHLNAFKMITLNQLESYKQVKTMRKEQIAIDMS